MAHQRNWWIRSGEGFVGSFDAPWSEWSWIIDPDPDHPKERPLKRASWNIFKPILRYPQVTPKSRWKLHAMLFLGLLGSGLLCVEHVKEAECKGVQQYSRRESCDSASLQRAPSFHYKLFLTFQQDCYQLVSNVTQCFEKAKWSSWNSFPYYSRVFFYKNA